jgi:hypothetical protein
MSLPSQWSLSFWLSHQYPTCIHLLPHSSYMPYPSHYHWHDDSNHTFLNDIDWIRKPKSRGPCLEPLLITTLTYSLWHCPYQNDEEAEPGNHITNFWSFCPEDISPFNSIILEFFLKPPRSSTTLTWKEER